MTERLSLADLATNGVLNDTFSGYVKRQDPTTGALVINRQASGIAVTEPEVDVAVFAAIDNAVEIRDVADEAARQALTPSEGWIAKQDDTKEAYKYADGAWALVGKYEAAGAETKDAVPTASSTNAVTSGGLKTALDATEKIADRVTAIRATGTAEDTKYPSEKAVRDLFATLNMTGQQVNPFAATNAALVAVPADASAGIRYWTVQTADDVGTGTAETPEFPRGIYLSGANAAAGWQFSVTLSADVFELLEAHVTSTSGADYTTMGMVSAERLDQWGVSRRVQRIFDAPGAFDYTALNYTDRTAVFIRNSDAVNGMPITYGAGGAVTLEITHANGVKQTIAGQDTFSNLQPNEFAVFEKDGNTARLDIMSGERVSYFDDYADAALKAPTMVAHDGLAIIRSPGELWGRKTTTNSVAFPADGVPNGDWFKIISKDPQSLLLNYINVEMRSAGTNAGSSVALEFVDIDGNAYPDGDWVYSADLTQYAGGTATIVTDKAQWTGTMGIGRNKQGAVKFFYTGQFPNGLSAINATPANGGSTQGVQVSYLGTNYTDSFASVADVSGPLYWTTSQKTEVTDQAAPFMEATEYPAGSIFSNPEPDAADPDYQTWFNWHVNDSETIADTDVPNGTEAEFLAIKPKLTRFGVGSSTSGTDDRVFDAPGTMLLDPLNSLSATDKSEFIHWTAINNPLTVRLVTAPNFVTAWVDYSGNNLAQPTAANEDFVIPAGVQMWVHRVGNAVSVVFEPSEGGASGPEFDLTDIADGDTVKWDAPNSKFIKDAVAITGNAVERDVIQANRGSVMSFGDLQFRVPSSGNSSLQMRYAAGVTTISDFTTKWSNQQGGASENGFGFNLGSAWSYFRANGALNLTLHNSYQDGTFVCNGWLYRVEVIVGSGWTNNRFSFSRWRLEGLKGEPGTDGVDAASIDHVSLTTGDSSPGTTDTYTLWGDAGETVSLGTYDVPIPAAVGGVQSVELGAYSGAYTTGRSFTLPGGRTWQDVLDEFQFVYVMVGGNSLYSSDQVRQFHVSDLTTQGRDMACTGYMTHGSNAYHFRLITPSTSSTTVTINNDNSSMQVQRIKVIGIK